jgi:hypothetical protein
MQDGTILSDKVPLISVLEMWKCFARKHLQLRLQYSYHSGESRQIWGWPYNAQCAWTTFWETFTPVNCQHCAKCAHKQHSERLSLQKTANTVQNVHAQYSEGPSHQETDSTVQNVHTYNILKDLHIRDLMAPCEMCATFSGTFRSEDWWH